MPLPTSVDPATRAPVLERWLATKIEGATNIRISDIGGTAGAGFVNETLLFDARWDIGEGERSAGYVLRVQPSEYTVFYRAADFFKPQYRLMKILSEQTDVPVPAVHWFEPDSSWLGAPFFVMEKVSGDPLPDLPPYFTGGWLHDASPEEQQKLWFSVVDALAQINTVDWRAAGLAFLTLDESATPGYDQRLAYYAEAFDWARQGTENPIVEAALAWLTDHRPAEEPVALCWGDARPGNVIYRGFEVAAVIDWEIASLGPPLQDLGWWFFMHRAFFGDTFTGDPTQPTGLPGFPARERTLARWEELTSYSAAAIHFHEVFAGFRMAVHLQRMGTLFVEHGAVLPDSRWASNNLATQALAPLIGVAHPDPEPMPSILTGAA